MVATPSSRHCFIWASQRCYSLLRKGNLRLGAEKGGVCSHTLCWSGLRLGLEHRLILSPVPEKTGHPRRSASCPGSLENARQHFYWKALFGRPLLKSYVKGKFMRVILFLSMPLDTCWACGVSGSRSTAVSVSGTGGPLWVAWAQLHIRGPLSCLALSYPVCGPKLPWRHAMHTKGPEQGHFPI